MVTQAQAAAFLVDRFGPDVAEIAPIGKGEWSRAYAFRAGDDELVTRFGQHVEDFHKDRLAVRYASPNLPIPRVIEVGEAFDGHYAVSERVPGGFIDDLSLEELRATVPSVMAALDAMRDADISETTGYGGWGVGGDAPFPSWRAFLLDGGTDGEGGRVAGWRQLLADSRVGVDAYDEATACLAELVDACPEERYLIHSDLLHVNVLVQGARICGIVDWGCAMYGDFFYDLAWLDFWSNWYPAWEGIDWVTEAERHYQDTGIVVPGMAERLRAYRVHIGLDNIRYSASKGRWDQAADVSTRVLAIARGQGS